MTLLLGGAAPRVRLLSLALAALVANLLAPDEPPAASIVIVNAIASPLPDNVIDDGAHSRSELESDVGS